MPSYGPPPSNMDPEKVSGAIVMLVIVVIALFVWCLILALR